MERRKFTREFKLEAVRLIKERGVSYARLRKISVCISPNCAVG
jgi:transposase-like protein